MIAFSLLLLLSLSADKAPREALKAFNDLIGTWRATGQPEGTRQEKQKGFWMESVAWTWQFKGTDAWLRLSIEKGKYYTGGELRYLPDKDLYQLTLRTLDKDSHVFQGKLQDRVLTVERTDPKTQEMQRLVITLLHTNRYLYRFERKPAGRSLYSRVYQVGATKEGVPFAVGDTKPECIVSGGLGTIAVTYKGQTYYVCCSGCRDAFLDDPEKFIQEARQKKTGDR